MNWRCFLGIHKWKVTSFFWGARQAETNYECEICGKQAKEIVDLFI